MHLIAILLFLFGLLGCASQKVQYETDSVKKSRYVPLKIRLRIGPLEEGRRHHAPSKVLLHGKQNVKMGGVNMCVNAEKYYKENGRVSAQVAEAMRAHLEARRAFLDVTTDRTVKAHYTLVGVVSALYGHQRVSSEAQAGAMFGIAGALATAEAKTDGKIEIALTDLRILDSHERPVAKLNDVRVNYEGMMPGDAYCWEIYNNVHAKLRDAVEQLAVQLETEVRRVHRAKRR